MINEGLGARANDILITPVPIQENIVTAWQLGEDINTRINSITYDGHIQERELAGDLFQAVAERVTEAIACLKYHDLLEPEILLRQFNFI